MVIVQTYYSKVIGSDVYTWNVYKDAKTGQVLAEVLMPTTSPNYLIMRQYQTNPGGFGPPQLGGHTMLVLKILLLVTGGYMFVSGFFITEYMRWEDFGHMSVVGWLISLFGALMLAAVWIWGDK